MIIKQLDTTTSYKHVVVELDYNELRDLSNGLFYVSNNMFCDTPSEYKDVYKKSKLLFDLVKHGTIMPETAEKFVEKTCPADCKGALNNGKRK